MLKRESNLPFKASQLASLHHKVPSKTSIKKKQLSQGAVVCRTLQERGNMEIGGGLVLVLLFVYLFIYLLI